MKKISQLLLIALFAHILPYEIAAQVAPSSMPTPETLSTKQQQEVADTIRGTNKKKSRGQKNVTLKFENEPLVNIINYLASKKDVNVILPLGANAITARVTLSLDEPITMRQAWDMLYLLIDLAGYSLIKRDLMYQIVKNSKDISREPLPIYIATAWEKLPDSQERIHFVHYFTNIRTADNFDAEIGVLVKELLSEDAAFKVDAATNSIIITDKSANVKALMRILAVMDASGFQEKMEIIHLRYSTASDLSRILNDGILKGTNEANRYRVSGAQPQSESTYFSKNLKIIPDIRGNALIVLGRAQDVERLQNFINKYLDTPPDSGKSILHVYQLQYLDAEEFEPVLQRIVASSRTGGTEQSTAIGGQGGVERGFDEVIIKADKPLGTGNKDELNKYYGGNKLIIAARSEDWKRIRKLIEQLDVPQPQVILEVLLADLTLDDTRQLGSILRNPLSLCSHPNGPTAQAAEFGPVIFDANDSTAPDINNTNVATDLLENIFQNPNNSSSSTLSDLPVTDASLGFAPAGSTIISFGDPNGSTWGLLKILQKFTLIEIISHPHVVVNNNEQATIYSGEQRLVVDEAVASSANTTIRKKPINAKLEVKMKPRISSADTVNLSIVIDVDDFTTASTAANGQNGNRIVRKIQTNATVKSGSILVVGGLIRSTTQATMRETPVLGKIPIIGWFFKSKDNDLTKASLTAFIMPTILQPRLRGGAGVHTMNQITLAQQYSESSNLFDSLRDPITRWFFPGDPAAKQITRAFIEREDFNHTLLDKTAPNKFDRLFVSESGAEAEALKSMLASMQNPLDKPRSTETVHSAPAA